LFALFDNLTDLFIDMQQKIMKVPCWKKPKLYDTKCQHFYPHTRMEGYGIRYY